MRALRDDGIGTGAGENQKQTLEDSSVPVFLQFSLCEVIGGDWMPRRARVVFEGVVHHITQRGNYRQNVFEDDSDKRKYVEFIREYSHRDRDRLHFLV